MNIGIKYGTDLRGLNVVELERWFSVEEISTHLGVSKETIYRWVDKKKIPSHKVGRQWKFKVSEVDQWVKCGEAR